MFSHPADPETVGNVTKVEPVDRAATFQQRTRNWLHVEGYRREWPGLLESLVGLYQERHVLADAPAGDDGVPSQRAEFLPRLFQV